MEEDQLTLESLHRRSGGFGRYQLFVVITLLAAHTATQMLPASVMLLVFPHEIECRDVFSLDFHLCSPEFACSNGAERPGIVLRKVKGR